MTTMELQAHCNTIGWNMSESQAERVLAMVAKYGSALLLERERKVWKDTKKNAAIHCGHCWRVTDTGVSKVEFASYAKSTGVKKTVQTGVRTTTDLQKDKSERLESRRRMFVIGQGVPCRKKPNTYGTFRPNGTLTGMALSRGMIKANRVSTWSINITK